MFAGEGFELRSGSDVAFAVVAAVVVVDQRSQACGMPAVLAVLREVAS